MKIILVMMMMSLRCQWYLALGYDVVSGRCLYVVLYALIVFLDKKHLFSHEYHS